jgi:hypothetical protein
MHAFANELKSLKDMNTFKQYFGDVKDIPKGALLSSKAIFFHCLQSRWDIQKVKSKIGSTR